MNKITNGEKKNRGFLVKNPIQRSLLIIVIVFMVLLSVSLALFAYRMFSQSLYADYNTRLTGVIELIEDVVDADDLEECLKTGVDSEKRRLSQRILNVLIDDMGMDYIYIVIPKPYDGRGGLMVNALSATSAAEREAGEEDMKLLETVDAYSVEELNRFASFWDKKGEINYFEESSTYGRFYTACKPLCNSSGETVALTCVDLSSEVLHAQLTELLVYSVVASVLIVGIFGVIVIIWLRRKVTNPLLALENSTRAFAEKNRDKKDIRDFHFDMPSIKTQNEVQSLGEAINKMADDMRAYVEEILSAEGRIQEKEVENRRLAEHAEALAKIASLKESVSVLFGNMPALAFSKDVVNGKYISCNKAFADYARKDSVVEIVGLTDRDIFDEETALRIAEDDKKALAMDKPYIYYEEVCDINGRVRQMQTTKVKFTDPSGKLCILAMCVDITEINEIKKESMQTKAAYEKARDASVTYSNIARALAIDYAYIYYIDLRNDLFIEYSQSHLGEEMLVERRGNDFFGQSRRDAEKLLHVDDRAAFIQAFTKENVLSAIRKRGKFTFTYRLLVDGEPLYMGMKATMMENDDDHLIIGVNNVDAQMKYQEAFERVEEERIIYSRITALSGNYICVYTVDPDTDRYTEYSATKAYEDMGLAKDGENFFERATAEDSLRVIYEGDRDRFKKTFNKENVKKEIKENKLFAITYRLMIGNVPTYVRLKAAIVNEKDGPQLVIGIIDIDAQVKREEEYARILSLERAKANIDALTGLKNKHAYVDVETQLNHGIEEDEDVEFAIAVFDINGLKKVNDTYGHNQGDQLIKDAGQLICETFKHSPVFRIGGDEFVVIAQGQDYECMAKLIDKIKRNCKKNMSTGKVVVACGYAVYDNDKNVSAVFERADRKMYDNKKRMKLE